MEGTPKRPSMNHPAALRSRASKGRIRAASRWLPLVAILDRLSAAGRSSLYQKGSLRPFWRWPQERRRQQEPHRHGKGKGQTAQQYKSGASNREGEVRGAGVLQNPHRGLKLGQPEAKTDFAGLEGALESSPGGFEAVMRFSEGRGFACAHPESGRLVFLIASADCAL